MPSRLIIRYILSAGGLLVGLLLGACDFESPATSGGEPAVIVERPNDTLPEVDLVDPTIAAAVAGEDGWNYSRVAEVDLTGDGTAERIVLTARVELYQGRPAWDDGQPWQVYVETSDGDRTYIYARRLQLGTLNMRITAPDAQGRPTILLIEHLPDRFAVYEATVAGPGAATVTVPFERTVDPRGETASPALP